MNRTDTRIVQKNNIDFADVINSVTHSGKCFPQCEYCDGGWMRASSMHTKNDPYNNVCTS